MNLQVFSNWETASRAAAGVLLDVVRAKPMAAICFATGNTPKQLYRELVQAVRAGQASLHEIQAFTLDETGTVAEDGVPFFRRFMEEHLYDPVELRSEQIDALNPLAADLDQECRRYEASIRQAGGLDAVILGIGLNGHLAYNEPGSSRHSRTRRVALEASSSQAAANYFPGSARMEWGLTLGLADILAAKRLVVLANGANKAEIVRRALEAPISAEVPASFLREHPNVDWFLDEQAAALLDRRG